MRAIKITETDWLWEYKLEIHSLRRFLVLKTEKNVENNTFYSSYCMTMLYSNTHSAHTKSLKLIEYTQMFTNKFNHIKKQFCK